MSAETTVSEPQPAVECGDGLRWDSEKGECVPEISEGAGPSAASAEKGASKGLVNMVRAVVKELVPVLREEFRTEARAMIDLELSTLKSEFGNSLRKELGLTTDPTVTKSELDGAIRKAVLDLKTGGKRTPTGEPIAKGAGDNVKPLQPGDIFKNYGGN